MKTAITEIIKIVLLASFILLNMVGTNYAQETSVRFENFPVPIKNNIDVVPTVAQDSTGFMWFGTSNGLFRYDGYNFTQFALDPSDSTSLLSNDIETIYVDHEETLWIGTHAHGLSQFDSETETFSHFRHNPKNPDGISSDSVTVITEDHLGQLWVGTKTGLNRLDRKTNTFTRFHYNSDDSTSLGNDEVRSLYVDSQGTLWVGTLDFGDVQQKKPGPGGLNRFIPESGTFTRYLHDPDDPNSLMSNRVTSMYENSRGTFWVGTLGNIVHKMDRETGQFERLVYNPKQPERLQSSTELSLPPFCVDLFCGAVRFITEDDSGSLWLGFFGEELLLLDLDTDELIQFENRSDYSSTFTSNYLWNVLKSRDGALWITTLGGQELNVVTTSEELFEHYSQDLWSVTALHVASSGQLWVGERFNIYTLSPDISGAFTYNLTDISVNPPSRTIATIEQSENGTLWAGVYEGTPHSRNGGLYHVDSQSLDLTSVITDSTRQEYIGPIIDIYEDPDGALWLATKYTGLFRFDRNTDMLNQYEHDPLDPNSLSDNNLTVIHGSKSEPGILWIGTERGLNRFEPETETFTRFLNDPNNPNRSGDVFINHIHEDNHSHLWIGTRTAGLKQFDVNSQTIVQYSTYNSGISSNNIACILNDNDGFLWMGTERGLTRFDPETELFYTFRKNHGVQEAPFMNQCTQDSEGRLIFSGSNGFVVFQPDEIQPRQQPSPVVFTDFYLDNQPIRPGSDSPLLRLIWMTKQIQLPFSQNTFAFEYSVLDYRNSEANQYAYRLEGYDESWRESGNLRRATYERIPAGNYTFRVRAANSDGVWNVEGASIGITILPPWWRTWWAYGLYAFIFAAGIFAVDRFQRRRLIAKEQEKARERELEQAREIEKAYQNLETAHSKLEAAHENLKSAQDQLVQQEKLASLGQLTAGIAHEIKNPLNFVNNFSDLSEEMIEELIAAMKDGDLNEAEEIARDISQNLKKIHEHGSRADGIVKSMLQHSRGGSGKMEPTDVNALIKEYTNLAFHGMRAGKDPIDVDIELQLDANIGEVEMIAEDFSRVILNLCNNAFDAMRDKLTADSRQLSDDPKQSYEPKLTICTHKKDDRITIEIRDNGPGIPDDIKDKIMQPFFTTKKGTAGTGLGLSITNDIIKAHGGELMVNTNPTGTTFIILLKP